MSRRRVWRRSSSNCQGNRMRGTPGRGSDYLILAHSFSMGVWNSWRGMNTVGVQHDEQMAQATSCSWVGEAFRRTDGGRCYTAARR